VYPEKTTDLSVASHGQTLSDNVVSSTLRHDRESNSQRLLLLGDNMEMRKQ